MLGLAAKKGSAVSGGSVCERALRRGTGELLILSGDSSGNTKERFMRLSQVKGIEYIVFGGKSELGRRVGRGERSVIIITDRGLARGIRVLLGFASDKNGGVKFGKNQGL